MKRLIVKQKKRRLFEIDTTARKLAYPKYKLIYFLAYYELPKIFSSFIAILSQD